MDGLAEGGAAGSTAADLGVLREHACSGLWESRVIKHAPSCSRAGWAIKGDSFMQIKGLCGGDLRKLPAVPVRKAAVRCHYPHFTDEKCRFPGD